MRPETGGPQEGFLSYVICHAGFMSSIDVAETGGTSGGGSGRHVRLGDVRMVFGAW